MIELDDGPELPGKVNMWLIILVIIVTVFAALSARCDSAPAPQPSKQSTK